MPGPWVPSKTSGAALANVVSARKERKMCFMGWFHFTVAQRRRGRSTCQRWSFGQENLGQENEKQNFPVPNLPVQKHGGHSRYDLHHLQPFHRPGAAGELVTFNAQPLQHRDEQIRQRIVVGFVESEVLAVFESAAGQQHRQVVIVVVVAVAEIAAVEDLRAVEQRGVALDRKSVV